MFDFDFLQNSQVADDDDAAAIAADAIVLRLVIV